jgi:hypothetical protein
MISVYYVLDKLNLHAEKQRLTTVLKNLNLKAEGFETAGEIEQRRCVWQTGVSILDDNLALS